MSQYIYGRNAVSEWIENGLPFKKCLVLKGAGGASFERLVERVQKQGKTIQRVDKNKLTEYAGHERHQGIVLLVDAIAYSSIDACISRATASGEPLFLLFLDGLQDPHNLGAIIRSADAAGVHGIVLPRDQSVGLTPAVLKVSAGAAIHVPVVQVTNLVRTMKALKDIGVWFAGADGSAPKTYTSMDFRGPVGIVLGSEGKGMRRLVKENCDFLVSIPMKGQINSLNVSVAAGILMFEARRQKEMTTA